MRWLLVLVTIVLAGCASSPPAQPAATSATPSVTPPEVTDELGALEGSVVDTEVRPVAGALVRLGETEVNATTDALGRFVFSRLAPGPYAIYVAALGMTSTGRVVEILAGEVTKAQFVLDALPSDVGRHVTLRQKGVASCFIAMRLPTLNNGNVYCGHAHELLGRDSHLLVWAPFAPMTGWSGSVFEMQWQSTQALGQGMQGQLNIPNCGGVLIFFEGTSPLRGALDQAQASAALANAEQKCAKACTSASCTFNSWAGAVPYLLGPGAPTDYGLMLDQPFEHFHTLFFNATAPHDFSAVADG